MLVSLSVGEHGLIEHALIYEVTVQWNVGAGPAASWPRHYESG